MNDLIQMQSLLASGETSAFDLWEAEGYVGGQPVAGDGHGQDLDLLSVAP